MTGCESEHIPVVCGIIEQHGMFLAAQRNAAATNPLLWEFPGGKIDKGESEERALMRELYEELALSVMCNYRLPSFCHAYSWMAIELIPFTCSIISGFPRPLEHAQLAWVSFEKAASLDWAPADIGVLASYRAFRSGQ